MLITYFLASQLRRRTRVIVRWVQLRRDETACRQATRSWRQNEGAEMTTAQPLKPLSCFLVNDVIRESCKRSNSA